MRVNAGVMLAIVVAMHVGGAVAGTVFKCVDQNGKTVFSDKACGTDAQEVEIRDTRIGGNFSPSKEWLKMDAKRPTSSNRGSYAPPADGGTCQQFSSQALRTYIIRNQVVVGMAASDAMQAWGAPTRINGGQYAYHWPRGSSYFYVRGGCVSSVDGGYNG